MTFKPVLVLMSLLLLSSCNSTTADIDQECMETNSFRYAEPANSEYNLPFAKGDRFELRQGNCTFHTHSVDNKTEFAFDFVMEIGTPIHAARGGQVASVEERYFDGNDGHDNYIIIAHEDGTFSYYVHITHAGAIVEAGQVVEQGDVIGYSGNTGMKSIPHLHFHVIETDNTCLADNVLGHCASIPITFKNADPNDKVLEQGQFYKAL